MKPACVLILLFLVIAGCGMAPPTPLPTSTPTATPPSPTPSPSPVWFPPTATPTPLPAPTLDMTPTVDLGPAHGAMLFEDQFTEAAAWSLGRTGSGSALLGVSELSIAVASPFGYVYSLRQGELLGDFYLEVSASVNICRGKDEYGLLLRASEDFDYYRFGLSCDGRARVDRIYQHQASSPQPPAAFAAIPAGAPSSTRLGVWANGKEMRFYANDVLLFAVRDTLLYRGRIGVFARAASEEAMSVNYRRLVVYSAQP
jgi:hypothetical protein